MDSDKCLIATPAMAKAGFLDEGPDDYPGHADQPDDGVLCGSPRFGHRQPDLPADDSEDASGAMATEPIPTATTATAHSKTASPVSRVPCRRRVVRALLVGDGGFTDGAWTGRSSNLIGHTSLR